MSRLLGLYEKYIIVHAIGGGIMGFGMCVYGTARPPPGHLQRDFILGAPFVIAATTITGGIAGLIPGLVPFAVGVNIHDYYKKSTIH